MLDLSGVLNNSRIFRIKNTRTTPLSIGDMRIVLAPQGSLNLRERDSVTKKPKYGFAEIVNSRDLELAIESGNVQVYTENGLYTASNKLPVFEGALLNDVGEGGSAITNQLLFGLQGGATKTYSGSSLSAGSGVGITLLNRDEVIANGVADDFTFYNGLDQPYYETNSAPTSNDFTLDFLIYVKPPVHSSTSFSLRTALNNFESTTFDGDGSHIITVTFHEYVPSGVGPEITPITADASLTTPSDYAFGDYRIDGTFAGEHPLVGYVVRIRYQGMVTAGVTGWYIQFIVMDIESYSTNVYEDLMYLSGNQHGLFLQNGQGSSTDIHGNLGIVGSVYMSDSLIWDNTSRKYTTDRALGVIDWQERASDDDACKGRKCAIIGGGYHEINLATDFGGVFCGSSNVLATSDHSVALGGLQNSLSSSARSAIVGGQSNTITSSTYAVAIGGQSNAISGASYGAAIGGGSSTVSANGAVTLGGTGLIAAGNYQVVMGYNNVESGDNLTALKIGCGSGFPVVREDCFYIKFDGTIFQKPAGTVPANTADGLGVEGEIIHDDDFVYVKTSAGWKRAALATF